MSTVSERRPAALDGLEVVDVSQEPGARLRGHFRAREREERVLEIVGWALGDGVAATAVVVLAEGAVVASAPLAVARPDLAEKYPGEPAAASCGFRLELRGEGEGQSRLELFAVLEDETHEPLGRILCRSRS